MDLLTGIVIVAVSVPIGLLIGIGLVGISRRRRRSLREEIVDKLMEEIDKWDVKL